MLRQNSLIWWKLSKLRSMRCVHPCNFMVIRICLYLYLLASTMFFSRRNVVDMDIDILRMQEQAKLDAEFKLEYDRIEAEKRQEMHEAQMTAILVQRQIEE